MSSQDIEREQREFASKNHFYNAQLAPADAWTSTAVAALINFFGMILQLGIQDVPNLPYLPMLVSAGVGGIVFLLHLRNRKNPRNSSSYVFYLINLAAVFTALFILNPYFAAGPKPWVPFQANKLGCFVAAVIAPGFWVGALSISMHSLGSAVQYLYFSSELKARVAYAEPWASLVFGVVGFLALVYRFRRVVLENELTIARVNAQADHRMAQAFLMIRDRMNTPLQVLELGVSMLRSHTKPEKETLDQIERAAHCLQELNQLLNKPELETEPESR